MFDFIRNHSVKCLLVTFIKFLISSLSSSVVDLLLFSVFCNLFRDRNWGIISYIIAATVLARICSALYNFFVNYKLVFLSKQNLHAALPKYFTLAAVQMVLSALLVNYLYPLFGGAEVWVKMAVDVFLFFISFFIQKIHIY